MARRSESPAKAVLSGGYANVAVLSAAVFLQRLALPLAVLWLGRLSSIVVALAAAALAFVRADASDRLGAVVRRNVGDAYLRAMEHAPIHDLPAAEVVTARLAVAFPTLVAWAVEGIAGVVAGAAALPIVAFLLLRALGPIAFAPLAAAGAVGALITFWASRRLDRAWNEAWSRSRELLLGVSASYRGAIELRAHGRARDTADNLRGKLVGWSRDEGRARRLQAVSTWGAFAGAVLAGLLTVILIAPMLTLTAKDPRAWYRGALLLIAAAPTLQTLVAGAGTTIRAGSELRAIGELRAKADAETRPMRPIGGHGVLDLCAELRLEQISYAYPPSAAGIPARPALRDVNVTVPAGASLVIVGPNGAGKTTLLHLVLGLLTPDAGRIVFGSHMLDGSSPAMSANTAFLSQRPLELVHATVAENLKVFAPDATDDSMKRALQQVGLWACLVERAESEKAALNIPYVALSRGESKRLLLARTLLRDASMVVLDEPEANLDQPSVRRLADVLREVARTKRVIAAVHDHTLVDWADEVLELGAVERG